MSSSNVVMRPLSDGSGYSECHASEENVGKRRCNHTLSSVSFSVQVNKVGPRVKEIMVSDDYDKLEKRDKESVVKMFLSSLEPIDDDVADDIISQLRKM